jgi:cellulose biosynthesis protein BcsQ
MSDLAQYLDLGSFSQTVLISVGLVACFVAGIVLAVLHSARKIRRLRSGLEQAQQVALHEKQASQGLLRRLNEAQESIGAQMQLARETRASLEGCVTRRDREIRDMSGEISRLKAVENQARTARQAIEKQMSEREGRIASLLSREKEFTDQIHQATEDYRQLKDLYNRADWRILHVAESKGRIWEGEAFGHIPAFRPLQPGAACIISVMNLKGGVGKSTISANLGATLWKQGKRVLLIDLDFQGSLTSLCLPPKQVAYLRQDERMVQKLFAEDRPNLGRLRTCMEPIDRPTHRFKILAADDALADYEERLMARWLIGKTDSDVRFHLRELLHDPTFQRDFDYILLDCPPRRTTASINALACSDFVLIPTLLDDTSMEAAPRLLASLKHLKGNSRVCPNLNVLGILANMAQDKGGLAGAERERWNRLGVQCRDRWGQAVHLFETPIPQRKGFGQAAERNQFAVFLSGSDIGETFTRLAMEVEMAIQRAKGGLPVASPPAPQKRLEDFMSSSRPASTSAARRAR